MKQERLTEEEYKPVFFFFQEIKTGDRKTWVFEDTEQIRSILTVLDALERQTRIHSLDELDIGDNPKMFVENLLRTYPDHLNDFCYSLLNNFSNQMLTRAREEGKYAVLILFEDSVAICHTDSDALTISKGRKVIERLLDADNVDKYVRFEQVSDTIEAHHFERRLSKSFSEWLGIQPEEVAYQDAGDVQIYTTIDDSPARFEYDQEDFEDKFLKDEEFELVSDFLITPKHKYPVTHVKLGSRRFETVDEFFETFYSLYFDLNHHGSLYETIAQSMTPILDTVIDHESKVTKGGPNGEIHAKKDDSELKLLYADKNIQLSARWRHKLTEKFRGNERVQLHHAGMSLSENPAKVGPFEFYNKLDFDEERINQLYDITQEAKTAKPLSDIICCVIFYTLYNWTSSPIRHFFKQMTQSFEDELDAEGMVLRDEGKIIEFKSRDWVVETDNDAIVDKITKEIQSDSRLLLVGIEEDEQRIRPINRKNFDSERNEEILKSLQRQNGHHESIDLCALQLGDGECLLFIYAVREDQSFNLDMPTVDT